MADDLSDRSLTDPNGDPNWQPFWGDDESMSYGDSIPTPQAAVKAYFAVASTLKDLVDSAPRTQDGVQLGSKRAIQSELTKLVLLDWMATHSFYTLEKSETPAEGIRTTVHSTVFGDASSVAFIRNMTMLPLGTDWESKDTLTHEQVDLFNRRFVALENFMDRLPPEAEPTDSASSVTLEEESNTFRKPEGWVKAELVIQAKKTLGSFGSTTFDRIREATDVPAGERGGKGQQRRFSPADVRKLIRAVKAGGFRNKQEIAQSWQDLLDV